MEKKLLYNAILDLTLKKEFDVFERAQLLQRYIEIENTNVLQLSVKLKIAKSTLHDWLLWNEITPEKKKELNDLDFTDTDIYKRLRKKGRFTIERCKFDVIIKSTHTDLRPYLSKTSYSENSIELIKDLQNTLNRILIKIEKTQ